MNFEYQLPPFEFNGFEDMKKREAQRYFDWFVSRIPENLNQLRGALDDTGYDSSKLDYSDESLVYLCRWFLENAEVIDIPEEEIRAKCEKIAVMMAEVARAKGGVVTDITYKSIFDNQYERAPRKMVTMLWRFIAIDIGIYYGECLLKRYRDKGLYWGFVTKPKRYVDQNKPILLGVWRRHTIISNEYIETGKMIEMHINPLAAGEGLTLKIIKGTADEYTLLNLFRINEGFIFNLHSPGNLNDIRKMDVEEAEYFLKWFVHQINFNINSLKRIIITSSDTLRYSEKPRINFSEESLIYIWSWYLDHFEYVGEMQQKRRQKKKEGKMRKKDEKFILEPIEVDGVSIYEGLIVLCCDVSLYFAEAFRRNHKDKGIKWGYVTEPKTLPYVNRPVLVGFGNPDTPVMDQIGIFSDLAIRVAKGDRNRNALAELYDEWDKRV